METTSLTSTTYTPDISVPVCRVATASGTKTWPALSQPTSDTRSPVLHGDRVHALPYTRRIIEAIKGNGTLDFSRKTGKTSHYLCAPMDKGWRNHVEGSIAASPFVGSMEDPDLVPPSDVLRKLSELATTKALAKAREQINNLPMLFAERKQTVEMIARRGREAGVAGLEAQRDALRRYRRASFRDRRRIARELANSHLELLFGWLPIIAEVEAAAEHLSKDFHARFTVRGRQALITDEPWDERAIWKNISQPFGTTNIPVIRATKHWRKLSARCSLTYEVDAEGFRLMRRLGFNPLSTGFDLVPLSFLANFASNVQTWLAAMDPLIGATYVTGSISTWVEDEPRVRISGRSHTDNGQVVSTSGEVLYQRRGLTVNRSVLSTEPSASLHWVNNMTWAKAVTILALGVQRYIKPLRTAIRARPFRYKGPRPKWLPPIEYR